MSSHSFLCINKEYGRNLWRSPEGAEIKPDFRCSKIIKKKKRMWPQKRMRTGTGNMLFILLGLKYQTSCIRMFPLTCRRTPPFDKFHLENSHLNNFHPDSDSGGHFSHRKNAPWVRIRENYTVGGCCQSWESSWWEW